MSKRSKSRGKRINPTYWVFCEGETEKAYVSFLRSKYRLPIEIIPKVSGTRINNRFIKQSKLGKPTHEKDKDFLLYDGDVPGTVDQLKKVTDAILIMSIPCIELWFLYHYKNQSSHITCEDCIKELSTKNRNVYKKGFIDEKLRAKLESNLSKACKCARESKLFENPSSKMFILIEELERVNKEK